MSDYDSNFNIIPTRRLNEEKEASARSLRSLRKVSEKEQQELNRQRYLKFQENHMQKQVSTMLASIDRRGEIIKKKEADKLRIALARTKDQATVQ